MTVPGGPTFFFMHVMKTAGTSFSQHLHVNFPADQIYPTPTSPDRGLEYWQVKRLRALSEERRQEIRLYSGHFPYAAVAEVGADVTLAILRDPVERTVSAVRHCKLHFPKYKGMSLDEVYEDPWHHPTLFRNYQVKQFAMTSADPVRGHIDVVDIDDDRFAVAVANLAQVDVLGLTERYGEFTDTVRQRFGWAVDDDAPKLQTGRFSSSVSASLRRRIAVDSAADVAFYEHVRSVYERRAGKL